MPMFSKGNANVRKIPTTAVVESPIGIIFTCAKIRGKKRAKLRNQAARFVNAMSCDDSSKRDEFRNSSGSLSSLRVYLFNGLII